MYVSLSPAVVADIRTFECILREYVAKSESFPLPSFSRAVEDVSTKKLRPEEDAEEKDPKGDGEVKEAEDAGEQKENAEEVRVDRGQNYLLTFAN